MIEGTPNIVRSYIKHFDGVAWGDSILVASGLNFTYLRDIFIDSKNRLFVIYRLDKDYISYYSNGQWSQPISCPYQQGNAYVELLTGAVDKNNILHFGGNYSIDYLISQSYVAYFRYNPEECYWAPMILINDSAELVDIELDYKQTPHFAIRKYKITSYQAEEGTYHSIFNNTPTQPVVFDTGVGLMYPNIATDEKGGVHITNYQINWDAKNTGTLSYYYKNAEDNQFISEIICANENIYEHKLIYFRNKLYLLYFRYPPKNLFLRKRTVSTPINEKYEDITSKGISIYPNPFNEQLVIQYFLDKENTVSISIHNLQGLCVHQANACKLNAGLHKYIWKGLLHDGTTAPAGIYVCKISAGNTLLAKAVIKLNY